MKLIFIVNERAGNGRGKKVWDQLEQSLTVPYLMERTLYIAHAEKISREFAQKAEIENEKLFIVAIGGDGTIHEVINGVRGLPHVIVGAFAAGSGNDFARGYGVFHTVEEIEAFVRHENVKDNMITSRDLGVLTVDNGLQYAFVNNAGFGFDALVANAVNRSKLKRFLNYFHMGKLSYVIIMLKTLFTFRLFDLTVQNEDVLQKFDKCWFITASNQPYFGGGMKISPKSEMSDGVLELTIVHNLAKWKLLLVFVTVFFGKHIYFPEVVQLRGKEFTVTIHQPVIGHTDGEYRGEIKKDEVLQIHVEKAAWQQAKGTIS